MQLGKSGGKIARFRVILSIFGPFSSQNGFIVHKILFERTVTLIFLLGTRVKQFLTLFIDNQVFKKANQGVNVQYLDSFSPEFRRFSCIFALKPEMLQLPFIHFLTLLWTSKQKFDDFNLGYSDLITPI